MATSIEDLISKIPKSTRGLKGRYKDLRAHATQRNNAEFGKQYKGNRKAQNTRQRLVSNLLRHAQKNSLDVSDAELDAISRLSLASEGGEVLGDFNALRDSPILNVERAQKAVDKIKRAKEKKNIRLEKRHLKQRR